MVEDKFKDPNWMEMIRFRFLAYDLVELSGEVEYSPPPPRPHPPHLTAVLSPSALDTSTLTL